MEELMMTLIDAHSHLWLEQNTRWNGLEIRTLRNGRSMFLGEERQMLPPFMIDGRNTVEVFLSNMDYAQVQAAVVVQEFIDGQQNGYLAEVSRRYPDRFFCYGMADYLRPGFYEEALRLIAVDKFHGLAIPAHRLLGQPLNGPEMMKMFKLMEGNDVLLSITLADGDQQVGELREVIEECPRLKVAIGHLGMANPPVTPPWEHPALGEPQLAGTDEAGAPRERDDRVEGHHLALQRRVLPLPLGRPRHPRGCRPGRHGQADVG